jgi:hypothetical protein
MLTQLAQQQKQSAMWQKPRWKLRSFKWTILELTKVLSFLNRVKRIGGWHVSRARMRHPSGYTILPFQISNETWEGHLSSKLWFRDSEGFREAFNLFKELNGTGQERKGFKHVPSEIL